MEYTIIRVPNHAIQEYQYNPEEKKWETIPSQQYAECLVEYIQRELSELDQLIRRNLGLNAKTAGGSGKLQIDISILNNAKADRGDGAVKVNKNNIIDVEPNDDKP